VSDRARESILDRVRRALGRPGPAGDETRKAVLARLAEARAGTIPARADLALEERIALFTDEAEAVGTIVGRIGRWEALPDAMLEFLREYNLPPRVVMAGDPLLRQADWQRTMLEVREGRVQEDDPVGLTTAFAGIAETGTLMLLSGPETPSLLAFLPETVLVALPSGRVLRAYEDGLRLLRTAGDGLPRSINFITGPSRSADIEQTLQHGAHGPKRLGVVLVDEPPGSGP